MASRSCKSYTRNQTQGGFTLIEILVALMIISVSLGAVFQAFSQSKMISWKSDEKMDCTRIAQNIFSDPSVIKDALDGGIEEKDLQREDGWRYWMAATPLEITSGTDDPPKEIHGMVDLQLSLVHRSGNQEKTFEIHRWYHVRHE